VRTASNYAVLCTGNTLLADRGKTDPEFIDGPTVVMQMSGPVRSSLLQQLPYLQLPDSA